MMGIFSYADGPLISSVVRYLFKSVLHLKKLVYLITAFFIWIPGGLAVKNPPAMQEMRVQSLGQENPLEKQMAIHSNILAWEAPWTEEPGGLQSVGLRKSWTQLINYTITTTSSLYIMHYNFLVRHWVLWIFFLLGVLYRGKRQGTFLKSIMMYSTIFCCCCFKRLPFPHWTALGLLTGNEVTTKL